MLSHRVRGTLIVACMGVVAVGSLTGTLWASEEAAKPTSGVVDQMEKAIKHAATKLEHEMTDVVKKLEDSETPKKEGGGHQGGMMTARVSGRVISRPDPRSPTVL